MNFLIDNIGWILLLLTVAILFFYKKITNIPYGLTSRYTLSKSIVVPPDEITHRIITALKKSGFIRVGYNEDESRYYAQSKISMSSWTEYIEVKVHKENGATKITFTSVCSLPTQIVDWGKNKRNTNRFFKELNNEN